MKKFKMNKKKWAILGIWIAIVGGIYLYLLNHGKASGDNPSFGINVQFLVGWITKIIILLSISLIAYSIYRIVKIRKTRKFLYVLSSLLLGILIIFNLAVNQYAMIINTYFSASQINQSEVKKTTEQAMALTEKIEGEGAVLLENKNEVLPLQNQKVNVFGYASRNVVYGGTGSGGGKEDNNVDLQQGLKNAGFQVNDQLTTFYDDRYVPREKVNIHKLVGGDFNIHEPKASEYSESLLTSAKEFSDTALVVFSRNSGEGADITNEMKGYAGGTAGKHYLELSDDEAATLDLVKENFDKVVVILNSSFPMELGFLDDEKIAGALWIGGPGSVGFNAVGEILAGEINPSGRLVDTYAYDETNAPSFNNIGEFPYSNSEFDYEKDTWHYKYINYAESIYVGYRYYETRYIDNQTGKMDEAAYEKAVQYPFGYGLSYTNFKQEITNFKVDGNEAKMTVKVTNTGKKAGKDVVQLYYTPPYTIGGIEKSHVVLSGFAKTQELAPNQSEEVNISFDVENMASYDEKQNKAYVLEKGNYEIKLMNNSHDVIDSKNYEVAKDIVFDQENKRESDELSATNQFEDAKGDVQYLSRWNWEETMPKEMAQPKEASKELLKALKDQSVNEGKADPIKFKKHGLELYDLKGVDYDDPKWDQLLEQLSVKDMENLITYGGFQTPAINSVKKPATIDADGPAGINHLVSQAHGNQYTSEVVVASTWNTELVEEMGAALGKEAKASNITGLYLPGVNIHRSPFGGRNFEYYSEDALLSGKIGSSLSKGAMDQGSYVFMKHFAMYDQETRRYEFPTGAATWSTEQAMREVFLKPFEIAVKDSGITGIMSSYNRIGPKWVGESEALLQNVLRDEWGFRGTVISDFYKPQYMNVDQGLSAGNDLVLYLLPTKLNNVTTDTDWGQQNMRKASHNILYTVVNSHAYEVAETNVPNWIYLLVTINIAVFTFLLFCFTKTTHRKKPARKFKLFTKK
ncbi:beta-glucosidase [Carnobacterium maltaromaticum]|uniref:glycoside hydrolase family 3 protein n=2 Tax=Carnobacterium maltaromaticum TaxID=2751 RepID=UPI0007051622|nr:glycoside hydrolase family 3 protein [Carnobacterium maltaromaticum]KRN86938.1 beta-glucosidase-related glycosidase [Carnobacterium maltaromaticum]MDT1945086.1 glycoside hydrolase family 3 C-terminal domain-containing protein [Carnobacterium maltaromaticum]MDT1999457.1 glycoside hydrolase family 3 C-terminal domain-containing protein [Carnobacterium maltaromaticum]TFJ23357.1 beta-glucosidase [Carnobacterium maltaromaticum]TFJ29039.1 beta-glucosidase [Carnobacterium maltaromaticum]